MKNYKIIHLEETESTNKYALKHLSQLCDKDIVISDKQTAGRGRFDRKWVSGGTENIYLSMIFKPESEVYPYTNLTQFLSVILCRVLEEHYALQPAIKWPNDILINGAKISGILCEGSNKDNKIEALVLGLGVNLNMTQESINSINQKASSLNLILNKKIDRNEFLDKLLNKFFQEYETFIKEGFAFIKDEYIKRCGFLGENVKISSLNADILYKAENINNDGSLTVTDNNNKQIKVITGDLIC